MSAPTQKERVLRCLRSVGARGLTQVDFLRFPTLDGGPPITRVAARVEELRRDGFCIASDGRRDSCSVYVLELDVPLAPRAAAPAADDEPELQAVIEGQVSLFEDAAA